MQLEPIAWVLLAADSRDCRCCCCCCCVSLSISLRVVQVALAPLIAEAVSRCRMAEICGRDKPTVIT